MKEKIISPPAMLLGGAAALDFLNSTATPVDEIVEWLGSGADLLSWMTRAGLLADEDARTIRRSLSAAQLDAVAKDARALRDWFRRFIHENKGGSLKKRMVGQLDPLNRLLAADSVFSQIEPSGTSRERTENSEFSPPIFRLRRRRHWRKPDSLLCLLAEELARFICSTDFRQVKLCEGEKCTLLFLDHSHRHGRRWCSMAICGNRAKAAAFAARARGGKRRSKSAR